MKRNTGFTLLEVLLALAIFTIIGIATVRQITQIQFTKDTAFAEMDLYNEMRTAVSIFRYDVGQAFHVLYDDLGEEAKQAVQQGQQAPHTLFDGRRRELVFTSLSHRVYYQERRESEQTEISYFLQKKQGAKFQSLMKRESPFIDADLYQGGSVYTLIDNVTDLDFSYWDDKNQKWIDDWNSDSGSNRDRFPMAVKIKIAVQTPAGKKLAFETEIKVAFTNNDPVLVQF